MIEGAIAQAVPEHPKRDNIFSVSTAFGDAYLFEVRDKRRKNHQFESFITSAEDKKKTRIWHDISSKVLTFIAALFLEMYNFSINIKLFIKNI